MGVLHTDEGSGNIQLTATNAVVPHRCAVSNLFGVAHIVFVEVQCVDGSGAPADSEFTLTYHRERSVFGELAPPKRFAYLVTGEPRPDAEVDFNSADAANMVLPGATQLVFGRVGIGETHVQVAPLNGDGHYCALQDIWRNVGGDGLVPSVACFDSKGNPTDTNAFVTFSSRL